MAVAALTTLYYLRLDGRYGLVMGGLLAAGVAFGAQAAAWGTTAWAGTGVGLFVVGWVIQFIGHWWEGRKPAFVDDLVGLLVGPMFVVGEALFMLGWGRALLAEIEKRVGPTHLRDLAHPV